METIDQYIASFPSETQLILQKIRSVIQSIVPEATESISYKMPAFNYFGILVYFAGYKNHIGFYGTPAAHEQFKEALSIYKQGKGSVQFPLDKPIPYELIAAITLFKSQENFKAVKK